MTANDWVAIVVGGCAILTSLLVALRWVIKSYLAELKPNSGSSMKDQISRLETRINEADITRKQMKEDHSGNNEKDPKLAILELLAASPSLWPV